VILVVQGQLLHRTGIGIGTSGLLLFPLSDFCFSHSHSYFSGFVLVLLAEPRPSLPHPYSEDLGILGTHLSLLVTGTPSFSLGTYASFVWRIRIGIGRFLFPFLSSFFCQHIPEIPFIYFIFIVFWGKSFVSVVSQQIFTSSCCTGNVTSL